MYLALPHLFYFLCPLVWLHISVTALDSSVSLPTPLRCFPGCTPCSMFSSNPYNNLAPVWTSFLFGDAVHTERLMSLIRTSWVISLWCLLPILPNTTTLMLSDHRTTVRALHLLSVHLFFWLDHFDIACADVLHTGRLGLNGNKGNFGDRLFPNALVSAGSRG